MSANNLKMFQCSSFPSEIDSLDLVCQRVRFVTIQLPPPPPIFDGGSVLMEAHGAEGVCANGVRGAGLASCILMRVSPFMACACTCAFTASLVFGDSRMFVVLAP